MEDFVNTRKWPAHKNILYSSYAKVMVGMLFVMEGLSFTSTQWQDVLMIGLGGGVINNFLGTLDEAKINLTTVEIDPLMLKLAKEYFDLEESSTNTVVIADGIEFIHEASKNGQKYKSMIVDACYTSCPAEGFWELDTAKDIADILDKSGTLSVNILADDDKREESGKRILSIYGKYFATCFTFEAISQQGNTNKKNNTVLLPLLQRTSPHCSKKYDNMTCNVQHANPLKAIFLSKQTFSAP
ncbi:hypothetical protein KIN20_037480 [Parelaphostrongylus tenuis]|uniref:Spermidine synthase n=1 Tax=Parelaphostrongylus tenuis TaxID=148309 RepID=A0AAD5REJ4_PARTN|nr:hypothetical protein KIN20_037480 [Parelaphostrongylus tenuis]